MKRWFSRTAAEMASDNDSNDAAPADTAREQRRALLDEISEFMLANDLDASPGNYAFAHAIFAGSDLDLAAQVTARQIAGEKVDQAWIDAFSSNRNRPERDDRADAQNSQQAELDRLMLRLETSVDAFAKTASSARGATSSYGNTLEEHVAQIGRETATGEALTSFAGIARAMLERTRALEEDMRRSTDEAAALRERLERAKRDAEIDHLTGLPNRRAFEAVLETQYREAQQDIDNLSVAFCDIDHFKRVNDTHGHDTGDRVIQAIAEVLARISDERCHVARHGGEEFVMLFRGRSCDEASALLDQARAQLANRNFINRANDEPIGQITFSGGVADVFAYADPRQALKAADQALYRAKKEGRNRICLA